MKDNWNVWPQYFFPNTEHFIVDNTSSEDEKEVTFEFSEQGTR